jgi:hypothetical protein
MKKAGNSANFAAVGIISRRTRRNSFSRDKNKHWVTSYMMVYKAVSHVTLPLMREFSPAPKINGGCFPNSPLIMSNGCIIGTFRRRNSDDQKKIEAGSPVSRPRL